MFFGRPTRSLAKKKQSNDDEEISIVLELLKRKKEKIKTITYAVSRTAIYLNYIKKSDDDESEMLFSDVQATIYADLKKDCLKTIVLIPTEEKPGAFNAKITTIFKDLHEYQFIETLDQSDKPSFISRKLNSHEISQLPSYLDDVIPVPNEAPFMLENVDIIKGEHIYIGTQEDCRYWISLEKPGVLKKEIYRSGNSRIRTVEYRDFHDVPPGIQLPTVVIDHHYDEEGKIIASFERKITSLAVNIDLPPDCFKSHQE